MQLSVISAVGISDNVVIRFCHPNSVHEEGCSSSTLEYTVTLIVRSRRQSHNTWGPIFDNLLYACYQICTLVGLEI